MRALYIISFLLVFTLYTSNTAVSSPDVLYKYENLFPDKGQDFRYGYTLQSAEADSYNQEGLGFTFNALYILDNSDLVFFAETHDGEKTRSPFSLSYPDYDVSNAKLYTPEYGSSGVVGDEDRLYFFVLDRLFCINTNSDYLWSYSFSNHYVNVQDNSRLSMMYYYYIDFIKYYQLHPIENSSVLVNDPYRETVFKIDDRGILEWEHSYDKKIEGYFGGSATAGHNGIILLENEYYDEDNYLVTRIQFIEDSEKADVATLSISDPRQLGVKLLKSNEQSIALAVAQNIFLMDYDLDILWESSSSCWPLCIVPLGNSEVYEWGLEIGEPGEMEIGDPYVFSLYKHSREGKTHLLSIQFSEEGLPLNNLSDEIMLCESSLLIYLNGGFIKADYDGNILCTYYKPDKVMTARCALIEDGRLAALDENDRFWLLEPIAYSEPRK